MCPPPPPHWLLEHKNSLVEIGLRTLFWQGVTAASRPRAHPAEWTSHYWGGRCSAVGRCGVACGKSDRWCECCGVPGEPSSPPFAARTNWRSSARWCCRSGPRRWRSWALNIRTAVREPADVVLAVIAKSHHDADEMVASLFCLAKVEVVKCGLRCTDLGAFWWHTSAKGPCLPHCWKNRLRAGHWDRGCDPSPQ